MTDAFQARTALAILFPLLILSYLADLVVWPRVNEIPPPVLSSPRRAMPYFQPDAANLLERAASESMDEVVAHLNGKDAFSESDLQTNILLGFTDFERILMDSRTCRLVELLGHLPREEGRVKSQAICDQMYEEFEATIERVLASYEDPTAPKNHKSVITNKLALGAAIFAMAHFSGPEPVIRKVQRIDELARKARSRLQRNEAPSLPNCDLFSYMSIPDANFKVNVIAFAVNHGSPENRSRQSRVTGLLATIPTRGLWRETHDGLQKLVIYDWDQYSTYYRRNQGKILQTLIQACREDD